MLLLGAAALLAQSGSASVAAAPMKPAKSPIFVDPDQIDLKLIVPPPAANDSAQTKAEVAELHGMEARRTAGEVAAARYDEEHEDVFLYGSVLGAAFTAERLPLTMTLSAHVRNDAALLDAPLKKAFGRPRPYNLDKTLHPVCETNQEGSYPSGHALNGYLYSYVVEQMVPEKDLEIQARADAYAHSRMVCDAHYASDLEASRRVAYVLFGYMLATPKFQAELAAARKETRRALGLSEVAR